MHDRPRLRRMLDTETSSIRALARSTGISRNAIRRATQPGARDRYHRPAETDAYAEAVREVLADYPHMAVADIAVIVDWRRSRRRLSDLVAQLRPDYQAQPEAAAMSISDIRAPVLASVGGLEVGRLQL